MTVHALSSLTQYILHGIGTGAPAGEPFGGFERAAREHVAIRGAVSDLEAFAGAGKYDRVLADDVPRTQYRKTDAAGFTRRMSAVPVVDRHLGKLLRAGLCDDLAELECGTR